MFTSLGLGEMGYGLPGAIGASFTDTNKNVICLNCDGGIMMNLQELQTIKHHNLPIKIVIFNNDGYLMIKHTQKMLFNCAYNGVNSDSGLSLPNFEKLSNSFEFPYYSIKTWNDYTNKINNFLNSKGPSVCEVFMDPEQDFIPKVRGIKKVDNTIALTGEIDLWKNIKIIGGVYAKLIGAKNAGIKLVLLPKENLEDLEILRNENMSPEDDTFKVNFVDTIKDIIDIML